MAFDDLHVRPHWRVNCLHWQPSARGVQPERRMDAADRERRAQRYAREHRCSVAEARRELFEDED